MMNNILPDIPWHIGYAKKKEDDPRRHKARCIHYKDGICQLNKARCGGSAHCISYSEDKTDEYRYYGYGISHSNEVWFSDKIRKFCHDRNREIRWKFLKDIFECPICGRAIEDYVPLKYIAKRCSHCKILFVNEDVYRTYTEDVNKNIGNYILCLVAITPLKKKKQKSVKSKHNIYNKNINRQKTNEKSNKVNALGDDPRFKDIFASFNGK